jgi:hypothetical protein
MSQVRARAKAESGLDQQKKRNKDVKEAEERRAEVLVGELVSHHNPALLPQWKNEKLR